LYEQKNSLATGTITIGTNATDGDRVEVSDGTTLIYFIFRDSISEPECPDENDLLAGCNLTQVLIGANRNSSATRLNTAINDSILKITSTVTTNRLELSADFIDEKFNNEIITSTTKFVVIGMSGSDVDLIPALTFPTASEIFGE
jgi:hypothetical protein